MAGNYNRPWQKCAATVARQGGWPPIAAQMQHFPAETSADAQIEIVFQPRKVRGILSCRAPRCHSRDNASPNCALGRFVRGLTDSIVKGSPTVLVNGLTAARFGGSITTGVLALLIGDADSPE